VIAYRQPIRPGQVGRDVKAVKLAYRKLGVPDSGRMALSKRAGPAFVHVTKTFQRHQNLKADGIYGKATHEKLAPHFTPYMVWLYRTAKIRTPQPPPVPNLDAQAAAKKLLDYHAQGKYRADNSGDLRDIQATAAGKAVWSQGGYWVHIDRRVFDVLLWLIEADHTVGTFAICSDHHYDGPHGHAGGLAVDVSFFDGVEVASSRARTKTLELAKLLHNAPDPLHPWQLICGGSGYVIVPEIEALTIPSPGFYGSATMRQHTNHVHCGFY
jgi:hypothetical protein